MKASCSGVPRVCFAASLFIYGTLAAQEATRGTLEQARVLESRGQWDDALREATKVLENEPESIEAFVLRARLHERLRAFDKAEKDLDRALQLREDSVSLLSRRGWVRFLRSDLEGALRDFDRVASLDPRSEPHLWQRGIVHYYLGRFDQGRRQFESHRRVNGNDVENSVWHFLCVAKGVGLEEARRKFLTIDSDSRGRFPDRRVPMASVYRLFRGEGEPEDVRAAVAEATLTKEQRRVAQMYADLYLGLFHESHGRSDAAAGEIESAVRLAIHGHAMWEVARIHQDRR